MPIAQTRSWTADAQAQQQQQQQQRASMPPQQMRQQLQPWRRRRRAAPALLLALAAALACHAPPVGASNRAALDTPSSRALLDKQQAECGIIAVPALSMDDPAAVVTLDVEPTAADGSEAPPQGPPRHFRQYQVIYKTEVVIREFPEHFMYSLGTYDPDQSNETVQVFHGGEPYLKNEECPGPSRAVVQYTCREDVPDGQERLVEAREARPGSCDFRLTVETRRVCVRPLDEL